MFIFVFLFLFVSGFRLSHVLLLLSVTLSPLLAKNELCLMTSQKQRPQSTALHDNLP